MRRPFFAIAWVVFMMGTAMAQGSSENSVPREIGNRAGGFSFQPTPAEVLPRERSAGLQPSKMQQDATDRDLQVIDRRLLRDEGLNTKSVPSFKDR